MKISYRWLQELILDLKLSPAEVAQVLTLHSFETVVGQEYYLDPQITVVRVEELLPHPNADRLRLATVTDGQRRIRVVCGAINIEVGDLVPFAPPGSTLKDEKGHNFVLQEAAIRGQHSPGMLNSLRELGLGTAHGGIFILPPDTPLGTSLSQHIPPDTILEADITPNRASDSSGHLGLARELAALLKVVVTEPISKTLPRAGEAATDWSLKIENDQQTPRYSGALLEHTHVTLSPLWLQARLLHLDIRPINNVVDITNYVMLETGQPTHAFDAATLPGPTIGVRAATSTEKLVTLDGVERTLTAANLVIVSDNQPVALAGIMGGHSSEVQSATTSLWLEAANFSPPAIVASAAQLGLQTAASLRFSKGLDPARTRLALARAAALLQELTGAKLTTVLDYYPNAWQPPPITLRPEQVSHVAGWTISTDKTHEALSRLRCTITKQTNQWLVTPPADRLDLTGEHDLIEEAIRLQGPDSIPAAVLPPVSAVALPLNIQWREAVRDLLVKLGLTETYNYSFEPAALARLAGSADQPSISLLNPVSPELKNLRTRLLPSLLANVVKNKAEWRRQQLFEIGIVFKPGTGGQVAGIIESHHLAVVIVGEDNAEAVVQGIAAQVVAMMGLANNTPAFAEGFIGALSPSIRSALKISSPLAVLEMNLDVAVAAATRQPPSLQPVSLLPPHQYSPISKYPPVFRDLSVIVAPEVRIETVQEIIERVGKDLVVDVDLFDIYDAADVEHDPQLAKSVAFHLKYQSLERTLTDDEVNARHNEIVATLRRELAALIRE
ncbi:MAG: phenylalanine--tRNA ligase subunit beta [Candidatus Andersenbacteria bacterium]